MLADRREQALQPKPRLQEATDELKKRLDHLQRIKKLFNQIHAAQSVEHICLNLSEEILAFFDVGSLTIYALDQDSNEIVRFVDYRSNPALKELRLAINDQSVAGFVAKNRVLVNLADAYDAHELAIINPALRFDSSWDSKTGIRTRQILAAPLLSREGMLCGVIELINKKGEGRFNRDDEEKLAEIAETLGIALHNHYLRARKKPWKFDYLISAGKLTQRELDDAVRQARETQRDIEAVLIEKYRISKRDVGKSLNSFYNCPFLEYDDRNFIPREALKNINLNYLKTQLWVPLREHPNAVEILIDDPSSFHKVRDIRHLFPGKEIKFHIALREDILKYVNSLNSFTEAGAGKDSVASILGDLATEEAQPEEEVVAPTINENDSAIVRLANQIIINAYRAGASDIHVEPYSDKKETVIRFRIDGVCKEYLKIPAHYRGALASRFKIMAHLDIAERRRPQDGKIKYHLPDREIELRVATLPTAGERNEDIVMRILAAGEPMPLEKLKMSARNLNYFRQMLENPYGLILCVGPTGSGKTTTLHSALGYLNEPETKIWTAEDPVEITQYGLRQVQVQPRIGFNFAAAMRSFLRADPDVIMIGEMRDQETAEMAIEASLTGHLVLSTLHTNSAVETVTRLLEMGMDCFNFSDALLGVLAQRLARTLCDRCRQKYHPPREEYDALAQAYGEEAFARLAIPYDEHFSLYHAKGCDGCDHSGYRGRVALHELLVATEEFKHLIQGRVPVSEMLGLAIRQGMTTLMQDGVEKILNGLTDLKQVKAVVKK